MRNSHEYKTQVGLSISSLSLVHLIVALQRGKGQNCYMQEKSITVIISLTSQSVKPGFSDRK